MSRAREKLVEEEGLAAEVEPRLVVLESLNQQIAEYDGMKAKAMEARCP